jgi:hypothetical protein
MKKCQNDWIVCLYMKMIYHMEIIEKNYINQANKYLQNIYNQKKEVADESL